MHGSLFPCMRDWEGGCFAFWFSFFTHESLEKQEACSQNLFSLLMRVLEKQGACSQDLFSLLMYWSLSRQGLFSLPMHGSFYPDPFLQFLLAPFLHTAAHNFCIFAYCSTRLTSERSLCLIPVESLQILYSRNTQGKEPCCEAHIRQPSLALFPGLPLPPVLIACSMQKQSNQKLEAGEGLGTRL